MSSYLRSWSATILYALVIFAYFQNSLTTFNKAIAVLIVPAYLGYIAAKVALHFYVRRGEYSSVISVSRDFSPTYQPDEGRLLRTIQFVLWVASCYVIYHSPGEWWKIQIGTACATIFASVTISHILRSAEKKPS